ncbi:MAG TPA: aromatic ring-hydroxylating dioxygenase subunit alpha [Micromonosporaceae bacterium]|jgi:Rieske 2Fe-2S family protein
MISPDLLDPAALDHVLAPFGTSRMLPRAAYTSADVFAWERANFFAGTWTCLGRKPARGQQVYAVGGGSVLVTVADEVVRAFANVCRHRGHELLGVDESADGRAVVCPYHGWGYGLDGSLRAAPQMGPDFDRSGWGLRELPIVDWHGWLFVNASGEAEPFESFVGEAESYLGPYRPERLHVNARHRYEVAANWKLIAENYHECYHCPMIHPELCQVTIPDSGDNGTGPGAWVGGTMDLMAHARTMSFDGSQGPGAVALPDIDPRIVTYLGIFPNLLVSAHPDYALTHRFVPLAPDRTLVECEWLFADASTDPAYAVNFWDTTNRQDWAAVASVQRGLASLHHEPGPLSPSESAIYDWVTMLTRGYRDLAAIPRREAGRTATTPSGNRSGRH